MKIGIVFFSLVKVFQGKTLPKANPDNYLLISDNEALKEKLAHKLQKSIERIPLENGKIVISQTISKAKNTEVILDTNYLGFKKAIAFLEENKSNALTFKLLPILSDYIIGRRYKKRLLSLLVFQNV
jgi:hypothetical protein